jgi:hypothetical protein
VCPPGLRADGQQFPIIRDGDGLIIDGRNRVEACSRAGVEPKFEILNGQDPVAFILSANIARRHLNKGQQAMAIAKIFPEPEAGGRGKNSKLHLGFSIMYLSQARTVVESAPDLADAVLSGAKSLNEAYEDARKVKLMSEGLETRLELLRKAAPDLADLVTEEKMKLGEAEAAARAEEEKARSLRVAVQNLESLLLFAGNGDVSAEKQIEHYSDEALEPFQSKRFKHAAEVLAALIRRKERLEKK